MPSVSHKSGLPFIDTTVTRFLFSRIEITHHERAIAVFAGPWGLGKTTAIDHFEEAYRGDCAIIKVDKGNNGGVRPIAVLRAVIEAVGTVLGIRVAVPPSQRSQPVLENMLWNHLASWRPPEPWSQVERRLGEVRPFTLIFDEAQNLSKDAIEMLRYWNDLDRTKTPFPLGLVFVGNQEFVLKEDATGQSALSGAVRSRALYIEELGFTHVTDDDLTAFARSRGIDDPDANAKFLAYYSQPRVKRDLRAIEAQLLKIRLDAGGEPISAEIVDSILNP